MYDDEYRWFIEKNFAATAENVNEVNEALSENEELETDSDATETDDEDYEAVSGEWAVWIYLFFCVTLFILQNLSQLKQWSMKVLAAHQRNNKQTFDQEQ